MFRKFASLLPAGAQGLIQLHPIELNALLEQAWNARPNNTAVNLGHPDRRSNLPGLSNSLLAPVLTPAAFSLGTPAAGAVLSTGLSRFAALSSAQFLPWEHLIYAYMIENTHIYEIFRRVVSELLHGEKLGTPSAATQLWLRSTEELFYRDPPSFSITTITSYIRPDLTSTRRNAYQRMFGKDLIHANDDYKNATVINAEAANKEFFSTFEEFLREVWVGVVNVRNTNGVNPTDDGKIADLATKLHDMLITRRLNGNLSREEFVFVSMMSWFHLTVESDLPVIVDLRAEGASPEQRLFKVAQRVGIPAHGLAKSYLDIAVPISNILIQIERGDFNQRAGVPALYTPAVGGPEGDMRTIIHHYSIITGREIKAGKVAST